MIIAKLTILILRLFGRGATTLPGRLALKLCPDLIARLSRGVRVICVTGTNGKTTTCALLEHCFKESGISYLINRGGANMITGVATAFIENSTVFGKCKKEFAILECDENSLPAISRFIKPEALAVTNLFRDQLDRYGEVSATLSKIRQGIENMPDTALILNADCPLTYSLSLLCKNESYTFGINASLGSRASLSDSRYCPVCKSELRYKTRIFAQLGDYCCPCCSYKRPAPDFCAESVSSSSLGSSFILNTKDGARLYSTSLGGLYNVYNFCAAAAVCSIMKTGNVNALCSFSGAFGRMERFDCNQRSVLLLLVKNPAGLSGCIRYVCKIKGELDMAFVLNDNEADGRDISWVWDCDFTPLKAKCPTVYTAGTRSLDMALRLKYDGIKIYEKNVIDGEDYARLTEIIKGSKRDFVVFSTYTAMMNMRHGFIEEFGGAEFWK